MNPSVWPQNMWWNLNILRDTLEGGGQSNLVLLSAAGLSRAYCVLALKVPSGRSEGPLHISSESAVPSFSGIPLKVLSGRTLRDKIISHALPGSLSVFGQIIAR